MLRDLVCTKLIASHDLNEALENDMRIGQHIGDGRHAVAGPVAAKVGHEQVDAPLIVQRSNPGMAGYGLAVAVEIEDGRAFLSCQPEPAGYPDSFLYLDLVCREVRIRGPKEVRQQVRGIGDREDGLQNLRPIKE